MKNFNLILYELTKKFIESARFFRRGYYKKSFYWFFVISYSCLLSNTNNSKKSSYIKNGNLNLDGFAELNSVPIKTCDRATEIFLDRISSIKKYYSIEHYFADCQIKGEVRPKGVCINNEKEILRDIFEKTNLLNIVSEHLGLDLNKIYINATVDVLTNISTHEQILGGYDNALLLHRDYDSLRFVKAFIYLDTVLQNQGHHESYIGSHRNLPFELRCDRRYTEEELIKSGIPINKKVVLGKKGFAFVENTSAFHRGTQPTVGLGRIMMSIRFNDKTVIPIFNDTPFVAASSLL